MTPLSYVFVAASAGLLALNAICAFAVVSKKWLYCREWSAEVYGVFLGCAAVSAAIGVAVGLAMGDVSPLLAVAGFLPGLGITAAAYVFYGVSLADKKVSFARWNLFGSVEAIGAIPGRDADRMGLAGWFNKINEDLKDLTDELGNRLQDSWGFELYYNVAITPWLHLTADLQLVENENRDDDFAVIPGGRLVIEF